MVETKKEKKTATLSQNILWLCTLLNGFMFQLCKHFFVHIFHKGNIWDKQKEMIENVFKEKLSLN